MPRDDRTLAAPPELAQGRAEPGHLLGGRYRLDERIGRGGVAEVWRARDERLGRLVAVKLLDPGTDEAFRRRFTEEARRSAAIAHANVVHVYDAVEEDGQSFLVMELVDGRPLDAFLRERGPLPLHHAARIVAQVAAALDAAHSQGIVHCDVKPANIIVDRTGVAKLADFGIAKAAAEMGEHRELVGTARYVAPEQVEGEPASPRSDVYSLALVAFELIAGRPAFEGDDTEELLRARLAGEPPRIAHARLGIPASVDATIRRGLNANPARRHASAGELAAALLEATESGDRTDVLAALPIPRRMPRVSVDPNSVILIVALALIAVGLYGFFNNFGAGEAVTVPQVTGQTYEEAVATLQAAGLSAQRRDAPARERPGIVVAQDPPPGTELRRGERVTLTVSAGLRTPNVIGLRCDEAVQRLLAAGFARVTWRPQPEDRAAGTVVRQDPAPDTQFQAGQVASVWYVPGRGNACDD